MDRGVVHSDVDRYIIVEYLAEGGMGAIFLGKKLGLEGFEKEVVLKQLLPEFTSQREFINLFLREAKLSASLDHANIVHTLDLVASDDDYFIVMEFVRGGDLRTILRRIKQRGHRLAVGAALYIGREVLSGLAYAHEKKGLDNKPLKIIHRDISPSNIMISVSGEVKLTDFGIAKAATHQSVYYRVKGKVGYMSPEQAFVDRQLDQRSDLYSAAVCIYEMLKGERLFVADILSTPDQIYSQVIPPLSGIPGVPMDLEGVMAKALAREPDDRYQTALEFQDAQVKVAYDNGMLLSSPDLAQHLRKVCGDDPARWHLEVQSEEAQPRGTEVLTDDHDHLSNVELTSIISGEDDPRRPKKKAAARDRSDPFAGVGGEDPTRHHKISPPPEAEEPTRFQRRPGAHRGASGGGEHPKPLRDKGQAGSSTTEFRRDPDRWSFDPGEGELEKSRAVEGRMDQDPTSFMRQDDLERYRQSQREQSQQTVSIRSPRGKTNVAPTTGEAPTAGSPGRAPGMPGAPGRAPTLPPPGRSPTLPPAPGRAPTLPPGRSPTLPPGRSPTLPPGRSPTLPPAPGRSPTLPPAPLQKAGLSHTPPPGEAGNVRQLTMRLDADVDTMEETGRKPLESLPVEPRRGRRGRGLLIVVVGLLALGSGVITALVALSGPDFGGGGANNFPLTGSRDSGVRVLAPTPDAGEPDLPLRPDAPTSHLPTEPLRDQGLPDLTAGRSTTGALRVSSSPPNASVYLDDVYQCNTPCTVEELGADQIYLLSVRRKGHRRWSRLVDMAGRRQVQISAYITKRGRQRGLVGYLQIKSRRKADIFIDGKQIGRVTSEGRIPLEPGEYEVMLSHPRATRSPSQVVTITARRTKTLKVKF